MIKLYTVHNRYNLDQSTNTLKIKERICQMKSMGSQRVRHD